MGGSTSAHDTGCCSTAHSTLGAHAHVPPLTVGSRCVAQADHIVRAFGADELSAQLEDWAHGQCLRMRSSAAPDSTAECLQLHHPPCAFRRADSCRKPLILTSHLHALAPMFT